MPDGISDILTKTKKHIDYKNNGVHPLLLNTAKSQWGVYQQVNPDVKPDIKPPETTNQNLLNQTTGLVKDIGNQVSDVIQSDNPIQGIIKGVNTAMNIPAEVGMMFTGITPMLKELDKNKDTQTISKVMNYVPNQINNEVDTRFKIVEDQIDKIQDPKLKEKFKKILEPTKDVLKTASQYAVFGEVGDLVKGKGIKPTETAIDKPTEITSENVNNVMKEAPVKEQPIVEVPKTETPIETKPIEQPPEWQIDKDIAKKEKGVTYEGEISKEKPTVTPPDTKLQDQLVKSIQTTAEGGSQEDIMKARDLYSKSKDLFTAEQSSDVADFLSGLEEKLKANPQTTLEDLQQRRVAELKKQSKQKPLTEEEIKQQEAGKYTSPPTKEVTPPEPQKGQGDTFGGFNEDINRRREERGVDPLEEPLRRSNTELWDTVKDKINKGEINPRELIKNLSDKPRAILDEEQVALQQDAVNLHNEKQDILKQIDKEGLTPENQSKLNFLEQAQKDNDKVSKQSGSTETARSLQARQLIANDEMDLVNVLREARTANPDKPLTPQEETFYKTQVEKYRVAYEDLNKRLTDQNERIKQLESQKSVGKIQRSLRSEKRQTSIQQSKSIIDQAKQKLLENFKKRSGTLGLNYLPIEDLPQIGILAREYVRQGVIKAEELVDKVYNDVKDFYKGIDKRAIRDAISGYGKQILPHKDEVLTQYRDAKTQMQLISKIEDAEKNIKPIKRGNKTVPSEKVQQLKLALAKILKDKGLKEDISDATKLKSYNTRLDSRINDLQERLKTGNYDTEPRQKLTLDTETLKKTAIAERLKEQVKNEIRKREMANRPTWEKIMDKGLQIYRQILLSAPNTILKLTNYGAMRTLVVNAVEDFGGEVLGNIPGISRIFEKAPSEGKIGLINTAKVQINSSVEWTKRLFNLLDEQGRQQLKTGKSSLDYAYITKNLPPEIMEFFGHLHGVLKEPTKRANFLRSLERRSISAFKNGEDLSSPTAQLKIHTLAYNDAMRSILLNDNKINDTYNQLLGSLENRGMGGKIARGMLQATFPIAKVPTNFVLDTSGYLFGGLKAGAKIYSKGGGLKNIGKIFKTAADNMTPEEADMVARLLKKNVTVGIPLLLTAGLLINNGTFEFGGYYQRGEKRKPDEAGPGKIRIGGYELPTWMTHLPPIEVMQFGATYLRTVNAIRNKNKIDDVSTAQEIKQGLFQSLLGLSEEIPFLGEGQRMGEGISTGKILNDKLSSLSPALLRQMARSEDTETGKQNFSSNYLPTKNTPKTIQRSPQNLLESVEQNIPGLRENVPTKDEVKKKKKLTKKEVLR